MKINAFFVFVLLFLAIIQVSAQSTNQEITRKQGLELRYFQNGKRIKLKEVITAMESDPASQQLFKSAKTHRDVSLIIAVPAAFIMGYAVGPTWTGGDANGNLFLVGAGLYALSVPSAIIYSVRSKKAVEQFNQSLNTTTGAYFYFGMTKDGVGLCFNF